MIYENAPGVMNCIMRRNNVWQRLYRKNDEVTCIGYGDEASYSIISNTPQCWLLRIQHYYMFKMIS